MGWRTALWRTESLPGFGLAFACPSSFLSFLLLCGVLDTVFIPWRKGSGLSRGRPLPESCSRTRTKQLMSLRNSLFLDLLMIHCPRPHGSCLDCCSLPLNLIRLFPSAVSTGSFLGQLETHDSSQLTVKSCLTAALCHLCISTKCSFHLFSFPCLNRLAYPRTWLLWLDCLHRVDEHVTAVCSVCRNARSHAIRSL